MSPFAGMTHLVTKVKLGNIPSVISSRALRKKTILRDFDWGSYHRLHVCVNRGSGCCGRAPGAGRVWRGLTRNCPSMYGNAATRAQPFIRRFVVEGKRWLRAKNDSVSNQRNPGAGTDSASPGHSCGNHLSAVHTTKESTTLKDQHVHSGHFGQIVTVGAMRPGSEWFNRYTGQTA